jgi:hypothetical protein
MVQEVIGVEDYTYHYLTMCTNRICIHQTGKCTRTLPLTDKIIIGSKTQILGKTNIMQEWYIPRELIEIQKIYRQKMLIFLQKLVNQEGENSQSLWAVFVKN